MSNSTSRIELKDVLRNLGLEVKPFPKEWCAGCMFNGCFPWCRNPLALCTKMGGLMPAVIVLDDTNKELFCASAKPVTKEVWDAHLSDLKAEAERNEKSRLQAMQGKVRTNQLLPAEYVEKMKENE